MSHAKAFVNAHNTAVKEQENPEALDYEAFIDSLLGSHPVTQSVEAENGQTIHTFEDGSRASTEVQEDEEGEFVAFLAQLLGVSEEEIRGSVEDESSKNDDDDQEDDQEDLRETA